MASRENHDLEYSLSPSLEDYLEEIYRFSLSQSSVRVSGLSKQLKVSLPSVTKALRKLRSKGYINYHKYGDIYLTDWGDEIGRFLVERNDVLQRFLYMLDAECSISEEAEAMEHYLSRTTIASIKALVLYLEEHQEVYRELSLWLKEKRGF